MFSITLKEIDHEIRDRQFLAEQAEITNQELVASKLPVSYHDLVDVFSKGDSDELPPHRTIDHKIVFAEGKKIAREIAFQRRVMGRKAGRG